MTTETHYRSAAAQLLAQARQELARGDARQASEKGWGAAAQAVTAVAEVRGWEHKTHGSLFQTVRSLAKETGRNDLDTMFGVASSLHTNFYENWMPPGTVEVLMEDIAQFVALLAEVE